MAEVYFLNSYGASPVSLAEIKAYLKIDASITVDDTLLQILIDSATEWGEHYTGREFSVNDWTLKIDEFADRIQIDRDPLTSITTVKHLVSAALVTVASSVYYLKELTQFSEILLNEDQDWPTDTDNREQAIEIEFTTKAYHAINEIGEAIRRHVAFIYENRGDCPDMKESAAKSSASFIYDQFKITRI